MDHIWINASTDQIIPPNGSFQNFPPTVRFQHNMPNDISLSSYDSLQHLQQLQSSSSSQTNMVPIQIPVQTGIRSTRSTPRKSKEPKIEIQIPSVAPKPKVVLPGKDGEPRLYLPVLNVEQLSSIRLLEKIEGENICNICLESYTVEDIHHIVTLKCGHLFGKKCIEDWLKSTRSPRCPTCNNKATKRDILKIYSTCVRPADPTELIKLEKKLEKVEMEKHIAEMKNSDYVHRISELSREVDRCQHALLSQNMSSTKGFSRTLPSMRSTNENIPVIEIDTPKFALRHLKDLDIRDAEARLHGFCLIRESVVVTVQFPPNNLYPNARYGLRRLPLEGSHTESLALHDKLIKDFYIDQFQNAAYTVSTDRLLKLSSLIANQTIQTVRLEHQGWSVHVNSEQYPDYVFVGFHNGDMAIYDRRNFSRPFDMYPSAMKRPVVSIQSMPGYSDPEKQDSLVLSIQSSSSYLYNFSSFNAMEPDDLSNAYLINRLPYEGKLSNASYDRQSNRIMISCRISQKHQNNTHYIFNYNKGGSFANPNLLTRLQGGKNDTIQSRSKLFSHPSHMDCVIAGAGDQVANGARFWNVDSSTDYVDVQTRDNVRDIDFINLHNRPLVSCLTDSVVKLYSLE